MYRFSMPTWVTFAPIGMTLPKETASVSKNPLAYLKNHNGRVRTFHLPGAISNTGAAELVPNTVHR